MSKIQVFFEIPQSILNGLSTGYYERVGGVIRDAESKRVVAWLEEVVDINKETTGQTLPNLPKALANSQQLMMGLQVTNLAVSAVGFAMVYNKLQKIENSLERVESKVDGLIKSHDYLHDKELIKHLSPVVSSIRSISESSIFSDPRIAKEKLINADNELDKASDYFRGVLGDMLAQKIESERPEEFAACYRAWVMANQGRVNTMMALTESQVAANRLYRFKSDHADLGKEFISIRSDSIRRIQAGRNAFRSDATLNMLGMQMVGAHEIIKGNELQLNYTIENNVEIPRINNISSRNSGYVLCLVN